MITMLKKAKIQAMKNKEKTHLSVLNDMINNINNEAIEQQVDATEINDIEVIEIMKKMAAQRQDSIKKFKKGNRNDLVEKEQQELEIIQSYLPAPVDDDYIESMINAAFENVQPESKNDMQNVMSHIQSQSKGIVVNLGKVSGMVQKRLQQLNG